MLYLVPSETQRGLQIPWSCSQRQLWATVWVLRKQPGCCSLSDPFFIFFCLVALLSKPELTAMVFETEKSDVRAALLSVPEGLFLTLTILKRGNYFLVAAVYRWWLPNWKEPLDRGPCWMKESSKAFLGLFAKDKDKPTRNTHTDTGGLSATLQ